MVRRRVLGPVVGGLLFVVAGPAAAVEPRPLTLSVPTPGSTEEELAEMHEQMAMNHVDAAWVIYLNKDGGTYNAGPDDSTNNTSSILAAAGMSSATFAPYSLGDPSWQTVLACVRALYADFDVYVTDEDPGATPHMETIVAGHPNDIGLPGGVGGIAPSGCTPIQNSVQYVFPETYGGGAEQGICEAVGQETAHSFGLEHEAWCPDVMTYDQYCGVAKTFVNEDHPCGEYESTPRTCMCSGGTQNSYQHLLEYIGPHPNTPSVEITAPVEGTVSPGFDVDVNATPGKGRTLVRVDLYVDGALVETDDAPPYEFVTDDALTGEHDIAAHAVDDQTVEGVDTVHVNVEIVDCSLDPTICPAGDECVDGVCVDPGGDGGGPSAEDGVVGFEGGGCSVGGRPRLAAPELVALLVAFLALASRRRSGV